MEDIDFKIPMTRDKLMELGQYSLFFFKLNYCFFDAINFLVINRTQVSTVQRIKIRT